MVLKLKNYLEDAFPTATIQVDDLAGDRNHYSAVMTAQEFKGLTRVKQHQLVYAALKGKMDGPNGVLHALALTTKIPEEKK